MAIAYDEQRMKGRRQLPECVYDKNGAAIEWWLRLHKRHITHNDFGDTLAVELNSILSGIYISTKGDGWETAGQCAINGHTNAKNKSDVDIASHSSYSPWHFL